jgi:hypothetical protein
MTQRQKSMLISAFLLVSIHCAAQQKPTEIKLRIKHNGQIVANPDRITLTDGDHVENVAVRNGKFEVPGEISHAKSWRFTVVIRGYQIQIRNLSQSELAYADWTLLVADHRYNGEYASEFPRGADIRSSCVLVLESEHIDPGLVISQTHCRSKS